MNIPLEICTFLDHNVQESVGTKKTFRTRYRKGEVIPKRG